jgi:hypothetical protein
MTTVSHGAVNPSPRTEVYVPAQALTTGPDSEDALRDSAGARPATRYRNRTSLESFFSRLLSPLHC